MAWISTGTHPSSAAFAFESAPLNEFAKHALELYFLGTRTSTFTHVSLDTLLFVEGRDPGSCDRIVTKWPHLNHSFSGRFDTTLHQSLFLGWVLHDHFLPSKEAQRG